MKPEDKLVPFPGAGERNVRKSEKFHDELARLTREKKFFISEKATLELQGEKEKARVVQGKIFECSKKIQVVQDEYDKLLETES